jgi:hypothetical protein
MFGDSMALTSQLWGSSTMICILPASSSPGPVSVTFRDHSRNVTFLPPLLPTAEVTIFNYKDEIDRALMELALQIVGMKMSGRLEDARNVGLFVPI